ncbi:MSHA biogenesis protein MshK [Undibacterium sp. LX15W]|uniref:MSHA biogenesis protein MshK n=2 Tax=Undibacterium flavidum TaxID=2762297 RepID=A0ABR6YFB8_9BURK|nr:MSHA biogenesis protein MshK [Undibacterium flavidum]
MQLPVHAQDLKDPTRPPNSLSPSREGLQEPSDPVLQSVLIAPNRKLAIIDGQTVKLYAKFGDQTLVRITETSVVLKRGSQLQTLNLHPDFSKKLIQSTAPSK